MKKLLIAIVLILAFTNIVSAQSMRFGANWGVLWPAGKLADEQDYGFTGGVNIYFPMPAKFYSIVAGFNYNMVDSKEFITVDEYGYEDYSYSDAQQMLTFFAGTQFHFKYGLYLLPAISLNSSAEAKRIGIDVGGGIMLPIKFLNIDLDISTKYRIANLLLQDDDGKTVFLYQFTIGLIK